LYVLISGEVDIWYEVTKTERKFLTTLPAGRVFGEMGLMTGEPRRATVIAKTDVECYRIDKDSFEKMVNKPTPNNTMTACLIILNAFLN
jgi:CRP-like cAMP-binding protein